MLNKSIVDVLEIAIAGRTQKKECGYVLLVRSFPANIYFFSDVAGYLEMLIGKVH